MTEEEFDILKKNLIIQGQAVSPDSFEIKETHISYLLLLQDRVYKIKKTLKLPFLDFSNLENRKHACTQELLLNRRLAAEIYLDVVKLRRERESIIIDDTSTKKATDYAVRMKRVDNRLEMDVLLRKNQVDTEQLTKLAEVIAEFHIKAFQVRKTWELEHLQDTFNQFGDWQPFVAEQLGKEAAELIRHACTLSDSFLTENIDLINQRSSQGWVRDLHGDLHSRNIFLTAPPLIFDCIEFDDDLRQIDVLNEIAFFLMDLDYFDSTDLGKSFVRHYRKHLENSSLQECWNEELLTYFKMYRASVRAKVLLISAKEKEGENRQKYLRQVQRYLDLVKRYAEQMP